MNVMDSNREREDEVFFAATGISDPSERNRYLDQACAGNSRLRAAVEEMLSLQPEADELVTRVTTSCATVAAGIGEDVAVSGGFKSTVDEVVHTRIDRYRILERLGEGGCGAVYLAEQESPVHRRVALKIIKLGMDTKSVIARFETERQMLAMMEHPNIARVLDAGATESGRPYFVMELVTGTKITDFCDQNKLSMDERLRLFIEVCHAVQHAHQKGIIHRDLKPSNILVAFQDGKPLPKVIDFGVAKAMQTNLIGPSVTTASGQLIGTPAYMSPEQAAMRGVDVDTRSDIYSLGVLLYELMAGHTPFDGKQLLSSGLDQLRKTLREAEPNRPSAKLRSLESAVLTEIAARRATTAPTLISQVQGDLDWIAMKALEKDPTRRYETAYGFLKDIERHLDQEPVVARPQTRIYRLQKLVRRNWPVFLAGATVLVALVAALGMTVWMLIRERELRQRAENAEREQARLREVAERGLANEAELRRQHDTRESIVEASALINQQAFARADELVAKVPLENPTLEGVEVFRTLGDWNAVKGNWQAARDRFYQLRHANRIERASDTSLDITRAAVTYIECRDEQGFEQFRQRLIESYAGTTDPIVAERVFKNCLLRPGDNELFEALRPFTDLAKSSMVGIDFAGPETEWRLGWCCLSLALLEYRSGNFEDAAVWSRRCIRFASSQSRNCAAQAILAMALYRLGQDEEARNELAAGKSEVSARMNGELQVHDGSSYWFDWGVARILVREAEALLQGGKS